MDDKLPKGVRLFLPSYFDLIIFLTFIVAFFGFSTIKNYDIWWHLKTGELILSGYFPKAEIFSFTAQGRDWILHEWGSEVVFAFLFKHFGIAGLVLLRAFIISISLGLIFKIMICRNVDIFISFVMTLLIFFGTTNVWTIRPHIFTVLFLIILMGLYDNYKFKNKYSILYWIPVLFLIWINTHGGFIIGFIFLLTSIISELINTIFKIDQENLVPIKKIRLLFFSAIVSFLLCLFNPNTYKGLLYPLLYISKKMPNFYTLIKEWNASSYQNSKIFIFILLFLILIKLLSKKKIEFSQAVLIIVFLFLAFKSRRHIVLFLFVAIPVFAPLCQDIISFYFDRLIKTFPRRGKPVLQKIYYYFKSRSERFLWLEGQLSLHIFLIIFMVLISILVLSGRFNTTFGLGLEETSYPAKALDYLKENRIDGNIINQYRWGGLLIHEVPDIKVFIDGRLDVYRKDIYNEYETVMNLKDGFNEVIEKYNIKCILSDKKQPVARFLVKIDKNWVIVQEDDISVILIKELDAILSQRAI